MTDIAAIFHWPLSEICALDLAELIAWRRRAIDWWNNVHRTE
jgi:Phage P2 GpE.